jgi:hypothetical protein
LFASADKGKTWKEVDTISPKEVDTISPDEDAFVFHAPEDGLYWLAVQTLGRDGKAEPSELTGTVRPQVKLRVKTGSGR